jgi:hypothetical protein
MESRGALAITLIGLVMTLALIAYAVVSGVWWALLPAVCSTAVVVYCLIDLLRRNRQRH